MPVIRNTFVDDAGVPLRNEWVMTSLISRSGWSKDGRYRAVRVHSDLTDANGLWTSPDLPGQPTYEEAGTYYRVECAGRIEHFDVPATGGPFNLADRRRNPVPIDAEWKVLAKLVEAPDATALAAAADGNVIAWNNTDKRWVPVNRVTSAQLTDGLAAKAAKQYVDDADQALSNRVSSIENWRPGVDTSLNGKASTTSVTGIGDRTTVAERDITDLKGRVSTIEGGGSGGSGGSGAVQHGALRYLVTKADGTAADDHPQYLTEGRGDARYYRRADADARYAGITHAGRHASGGADPITPAAIGAATSAHALASHPASGQIQPLTFVATASASSTNKAHATVAADAPVDNGPTLRSLRQPIVHDFDQAPGVVPGASDLNIIFTYDFTARESCDLWADLGVYAYYSAGGAQGVGATGQAWLSMYLFDLDDNSRRLWDGYRWDEINATVGINTFRTSERQRYAFHVPDVTCTRGRRYRFRIQGQKNPDAPADIYIYRVRGGLHEVAALTG